jgi:Protein tyrosine and serine/threonine kinase
MSDDELAEPQQPGQGGRKRRRIRRRRRHELPNAVAEKPVMGKGFDFLAFVSFIITLQVEIVLPARVKPVDRWGVLGEGGSFLVYTDELPYDHADSVTGRRWNRGHAIVLKRTKAAPQDGRLERNEMEQPFKSVIAELSVLCHPPAKEITLLGIPWDTEPVSQDIWPVLIIEYSQFGSLNEFKFPDFENKVSLCADVAEGLFFLHECQVAHCDVKSENVLVFPNLGRLVWPNSAISYSGLHQACKM